jgi:beta-lactam-binding protein with PASTA domain
LSAQYEIQLWTSDGSLLTIPNVVGSGTNHYNDAQNILNSAGFTNVSQTCKFTSDPTKDKFVLGTNPPQGKGVKADAPITVYVGSATPC